MPDRKSHLYNQAILIAILLSSLFLAGCGAPTSTSATPATPQISAVPFEQSIDVDLSSSTAISPQAKFTISNQGNGPIVMPAIVLKGEPALNRSSILFSMQGLKDEDFAVATWQFVIQHSQHFCVAGTPADADQFATDPLRLLDGFGFACCDQSGMMLTGLWQQAGYQARLVWMPFHEVPEIFYQAAWHMFDADHHVYYLQLDNKTVASTADVIANPFLVARVADANGNDPGGFSAQAWADQYAASAPTAMNVAVDYHSPDFYVLQPGQSLSINSAQIVAVFHGGDPESELPPAATGSFDWGLDYSNPNWSALAQSTSGLTTVGAGSSAALTNNDLTGFAIYQLSGPFPVISLQVSGLVNLVGPNAAVNAYFSTDGNSWSDAVPLDSPLGIPTQVSADLSSAAAGQYTYFVMLQLMGGDSGAAQISNVHIVSQFQDSIHIFPNLVPGQINHLTYQDWTPAPADHDSVKVTFERSN